MFELDPVTYLWVAALITAWIAGSVIYQDRITTRAFGRRALRRLAVAAPVAGLLWPVTCIVLILCANPAFRRLLTRLADGKPQPVQADRRPEEGRRA